MSALRTIGLTGALLECCGKAAAFVLRRRLALKGHCRSVRRCVNEAFSKTLRDVALRAIGLTGASALRLLRENVWRLRDTAEMFGGV